MKLCLMGDSHAAAFRQGWSRIRDDLPEVEMTFFAGANADWESVFVAGDRLVPGTEHLREQFARSAHGAHEIAARFDAYVLCGLGLALSHPLRLWTHRERMSWSLYRAAVAEHVQASECAHLLPKLREITARPALVAAVPHQPLDFCKSSPLLDAATAARLGANFEHECEALAAAHGAVFVPQPAETLAPNRVTTRMEFASGVPADRRHCSAEYGAMALRAIIGRLSAD